MAARFSGYGMPLSTLGRLRAILSSALTCEAQDARVQFAAIAPFLAEKMRFQSGRGLGSWRFSRVCGVPLTKGLTFQLLVDSASMSSSCYLSESVETMRLKQIAELGRGAATSQGHCQS